MEVGADYFSFFFCEITLAVFCPVCEFISGFNVELFEKKSCFFFACKLNALFSTRVT